MTVLTEGTGKHALHFDFSYLWRVKKYDDMPGVRKISGLGLKAIDFIAAKGDEMLWVVLFLHQDTDLDDPKYFKPLAAKLQMKIEQGLTFLNLRVDVVNELTLPNLSKHTNTAWELV